MYNILSMINGFDHIESNIINKCGQLLLNMSARTLNERWVCYGGDGHISACSTTPFLHILSGAYAQCVHSTLKPVSSFYRLYLYTQTIAVLSSPYISLFTAQGSLASACIMQWHNHFLFPLPLPSSRYLLLCPQFQFIVVLRY